MEREVKIYIGNAAKFNPDNLPDNLHTVPGYTVTDGGEIYHDGVKLKEFTRYGYKYVNLPINGKEKRCKVHRIVATTYQDICGEFNEVVNHLDENKSNNSARNLQWTTNKDNLTWGTLRERQAQGKHRNAALRNLVQEFYCANNLLQSRDIRITELKSRYKINDKINGNIFYTVGKNLVLDKEDGDYPLLVKPVENVYDDLSNDSLDYLFCHRSLVALYNKFIPVV